MWISGSLSVVYAFLPVAAAPLAGSADWTASVGAAARLIALPAIVLVALGAVFTPVLAKGQPTEARAALMRSARLSSYLCVPPCLILAILAEDIMSITTGGVIANGLPLQLLALGQILNALTGLGSETLQMRGYAEVESRLSLVSVAIGGGLLTLLYVLGYEAIGLLAFSLVFAAKQAISFYVAVSRALPKQEQSK